MLQLQAELQRARSERNALESRLKLLLQTRRAAGDSSAAAEASSAAAQLQSTAGAPGAQGAKMGTVFSFSMHGGPQRMLPPCSLARMSAHVRERATQKVTWTRSGIPLWHLKGLNWMCR